MKCVWHGTNKDALMESLFGALVSSFYTRLDAPRMLQSGTGNIFNMYSDLQIFAKCIDL